MYSIWDRAYREILSITFRIGNMSAVGFWVKLFWKLRNVNKTAQHQRQKVAVTVNHWQANNQRLFIMRGKQPFLIYKQTTVTVRHLLDDISDYASFTSRHTVTVRHFLRHLQADNYDCASLTSRQQ